MSRKKTRLQSVTEPPQVRPDVAGIDISPEVIYVAVDARHHMPVRRFGTFTGELRRIADWLVECGVRSVAMESTGVYWIPLYQVLEERGIEVYLVNARHYKNVPGRKTDVCDSAWLQYLHAVGLLQGSFRPEQRICAFRTVLSHRSALVQFASQHIQHMQKSLDQMNVQVHRVLSDITGVSGLAIVDAILAGERDGHRLAALRDGRVRASEETIVAALESDYRAEHLFTLRQSLEGYRHYQSQIADCDGELRRMLDRLEGGPDGQPDGQQPPPPARKKMRTPDEEQRAKFYRIFGTDLTAIPSVNVGTVEVLLGEVGPDLGRFRSRRGIRQLVRSMSQRDDRRREGAGEQNTQNRESSRSQLTDGGGVSLPRQVLPGSILPAHEGRIQKCSRGHYGRRPQTGAHHLHPGGKARAIRRWRICRNRKADREKQRFRLMKQARTMGYNLVPLPNAAIVS